MSKTNDPNPQSPPPPPTDAENEAALAAAAAAAAAEKKRGVKHKEGDKVRVIATIASQVNPLTDQRLEHGKSEKALWDRWIEIQVEAGVLALDND